MIETETQTRSGIDAEVTAASGFGSASAAAPPPAHHASRLQLVWDIIVFQAKLAADGLRDVLLSPIAIVMGILGLVAGGDDPHQYFRRLLRFGRRTEAWINLFGQRRRGTSDELADRLRQRVFTEAGANPWLSRTGNRLNKTLDSVHAARTAANSRGDDSKP